jgi:hypothetical protein
MPAKRYRRLSTPLIKELIFRRIKFLNSKQFQSKLRYFRAGKLGLCPD